ncbi:hypothetical protein CAOG_04003 [Capsaspora owczarzaki ATCC 30864]|uniref:hypothetical protein n=1 Tax=Capsaspora owczarzaki (strain ATCC 30864) TaxID=595528 RepID=UPI0001FE3BDB|nr:hypothetical protein CAOG_04003 [Capsaspora owczarzaki ATCC 30864]|eukprot:XP_004347828.1 hypothetical protein CAOG_04003 [Capsaspora owczarzaki ATCC 30864]
MASQNAVTDIVLVNQSKHESCPIRYREISHTFNGRHSAALKVGRFMPSTVVVCFAQDPMASEVVTDVYILESDTETPPPGFAVINTSVRGHHFDFKHRLCVRKAPRAGSAPFIEDLKMAIIGHQDRIPQYFVPTNRPLVDDLALIVRKRDSTGAPLPDSQGRLTRDNEYLDADHASFQAPRRGHAPPPPGPQSNHYEREQSTASLAAMPTQSLVPPSSLSNARASSTGALPAHMGDNYDNVYTNVPPIVPPRTKRNQQAHHSSTKTAYIWLEGVPIASPPGHPALGSDRGSQPQQNNLVLTIEPTPYMDMSRKYPYSFQLEQRLLGKTG